MVVPFHTNGRGFSIRHIFSLTYYLIIYYIIMFITLTPSLRNILSSKHNKQDSLYLSMVPCNDVYPFLWVWLCSRFECWWGSYILLLLLWEGKPQRHIICSVSLPIKRPELFLKVSSITSQMHQLLCTYHYIHHFER